jgi:hypothetical protein
MAVVQISKIQVRRGKKSQSNIPQLSGGELGWAVDSQQLYIGNGSVGEGAPFVGNTEVLTERSNIFGLLGAYSYQGYLLDNSGNSVVQTGVNSNTPSTRSLQQKLDDVINVRDFGAVGDYDSGVGTDDTLAIQRAIDQIFLSSSNKASVRSRRKIYFPAGTYKISNALYIPANTALIGDGADKTIFIQDVDSASIFKTIAKTSTPGNYKLMDVEPIAFSNDTVPTNVYIEGITLLRKPGSVISTPIAVLDCLTNAIFEGCKFQGVWVNGTGAEVSPTTIGSNSAVVIRGLGTVTTENVTFNNCDFRNVVHAVYSDYDSNKVSFKNCYFKYLFHGLTLSYASNNTPGQSFGPELYLVDSCTFDKVDAEAFSVYNTASSKGHRSIDNKYLDVGNNSLEQSQPVTPIINFRVPNCDSVNDYFQRSYDINNLDLNKTGLNSSMIAYLPDVLGVDSVTYPRRTAVLQYNTQDANPKILIKAPVWSSVKVVVDYTIRKGAASLYRVGQLVINAHPDMATTAIAPTITDLFTYTGQAETIGTTLGGNVRFIATVLNMTAVSITRDGNGNLVTGTTTKPTLVVRYINPAGPGSNATFNYTVTISGGYQDF